MNSNLEKLTMEELEALNQTEEVEMPPEKVVVEIPEEELQEMQDTQVATLKLVRQMATEIPKGPKTDNVPDDEDEGHDFNLHM